ncbi:hypothetical protein J2Y38_004646 [Flavobacterium sp. 2755]|nr:hypothetical protein [Flavobacterium sp. 2755]
MLIKIREIKILKSSKFPASPAIKKIRLEKNVHMIFSSKSQIGLTLLFFGAVYKSSSHNVKNINLDFNSVKKIQALI